MSDESSEDNSSGRTGEDNSSGRTGGDDVSSGPTDGDDAMVDVDDDPVVLDQPSVALHFPTSFDGNCVIDFQGMIFNVNGFAHACNPECGLISDCWPIVGFFCKMVEFGHCQDVAQLSALAFFDMSRWANKVVQFQRGAAVPFKDDGGRGRLSCKVLCVLMCKVDVHPINASFFAGFCAAFMFLMEMGDNGDRNQCVQGG